MPKKNEEREDYLQKQKDLSIILKLKQQFNI